MAIYRREDVSLIGTAFRGGARRCVGELKGRKKGDTYVTLKYTCKRFALFWCRPSQVDGSSRVAGSVQVLTSRVATNEDDE